ncbi:hypothetical protein D3C80_1540030 [compost metagenome]
MRGVFVDLATFARQVGHHHRAGVGRGEEQHETDEHCHTNDDLGCREVFQQLVDRHRWLFQRSLAQLHGALVDHQVQCGVAEDRQPRQGEAQRDQQHAEDQFTNGAPFRDARDKQTDEWCPSHPPGPIEQRPGALPLACLAVQVHVEASADYRSQIVPDVLQQAVDQV